MTVPWATPSVVVFGTLALLMIAASVDAQPGPATPPPPGASAEAMSVHAHETQALADQHRDMVARMQALDRTIESLLARVDTARGSRRVEAMAAVLKELASERRTLHAEMLAMQGRIIEQLPRPLGRMCMMHAPAPVAGTAKASTCPMMTGDAKGAAAGNEHPSDGTPH